MIPLGRVVAEGSDSNGKLVGVSVGPGGVGGAGGANTVGPTGSTVNIISRVGLGLTGGGCGNSILGIMGD